MDEGHLEMPEVPEKTNIGMKPIRMDKGKLKGPSENALQAACCRWFKYQYPQRLLIAVPNGAVLGGKNRWAMISMLKNTGLCLGTPDIFIPEPVAHAKGLWVEMKTLTGKVNENQAAMHEKLSARGYMVAVCRSVNEFAETVTNYFGG